MNTFTLRPAAEADMPAIRALIREAHINPTGLYWKRFIVAVDAQNRFVGCGQIKNHGDGSHELASIAVTPAWRGQGVARAIIERLLADHPIELYLTCRAELGPFYTRFGFSVIEVGAMTPYFRRLYRLASAIRSLRLLPGEMLVMKRPQPTSKPKLHN
jgi:N-acetylglutamate synthase-like GNAT family acetyltransferase